MKRDYILDHKVKVLSFCIGIIVAEWTSYGCSTISTYDEHAYALQTSVLADMLKLIDKATTPYDQNLDQIAAVTLNVERAYQYDRARPLNQIQVQMWKIVRDPSQASFAGFLRFWKVQGTCSPAYVTAKKVQIATQIDAITTLESGKIH